MAISLTVQPIGRPRKEGKDIPIAALGTFDDFWMPIAEGLSLEWIPLFRTGLPVRHEDLPNIFKELAEVRKVVQASQNELQRAAVLPRLDRLVAELRSSGPDVELYIG